MGGERVYRICGVGVSLSPYSAHYKTTNLGKGKRLPLLLWGEGWLHPVRQRDERRVQKQVFGIFFPMQPRYTLLRRPHQSTRKVWEHPTKQIKTKNKWKALFPMVFLHFCPGNGLPFTPLLASCKSLLLCSERCRRQNYDLLPERCEKGYAASMETTIFWLFFSPENCIFPPSVWAKKKGVLCGNP